MSEQYKIEVRLSDGDVRLDLPRDVALCLFRVAQESLGNVVKHSMYLASRFGRRQGL